MSLRPTGPSHLGHRIPHLLRSAKDSAFVNLFLEPARHWRQAAEAAVFGRSRTLSASSSWSAAPRDPATHARALGTRQADATSPGGPAAPRLPRFARRSYGRSFVPPIRPFDIGCCCRSKDRWLQPLARICLRTSSQGTPSSPPSWMSRSRSSRRRSSSARCSGVTGTSAGVRAKLSHSRSRRSRRSSGLRPSILNAVSLTILFSPLSSFRAMTAPGLTLDGPRTPPAATDVPEAPTPSRRATPDPQRRRRRPRRVRGRQRPPRAEPHRTR